MTGVIFNVMGKASCCHIRSAGVVYFAHREDFVDPSIMQMDQEVSFRVKLAKPDPGKNQPVTDVQAA